MMDHFTFVWLSCVYQNVALTMDGWNAWFDTNLCKIDEQFLEYHVRLPTFQLTILQWRPNSNMFILQLRLNLNATSFVYIFKKLSSSKVSIL